MLNDMGVRALCVGVLHQTVRDVQKSANKDGKPSKVEREILQGGIELYINLLDMDYYSPELFIQKAKEAKKNKHIVTHSRAEANKRKALTKNKKCDKIKMVQSTS